MAVYLMQGGLGLPDRDYYFNTEPGVVKVREAYVTHLARDLQLLGVEPAAAAGRLRSVMAFETALARVSRPLADMRDPQRNYNRMAPADLTRQYTPGIAWAARLLGWNIAPGYVIVGQPEFFAGLQRELAQTAVPTLRDYLRLQLPGQLLPVPQQAVRRRTL